MLFRFILYGMIGLSVEVIWNAIVEVYRSNETDWRLKGHSYLWMFPIYGSMVIFYEPIYDTVVSYPIVVRGLIYMFGVWLFEYIYGWFIKEMIGICPWHYSGKYTINGLINFAYAPIWFGFGLMMEIVVKYLRSHE